MRLRSGKVILPCLSSPLLWNFLRACPELLPIQTEEHDLAFGGSPRVLETVRLKLLAWDHCLHVQAVTTLATVA